MIETLIKIIKEKSKGIDTFKFVNVNDLGIPMESEPKEFVCSGNSYLGKVLRDLNITKEDSIVDLGCGKGGAVIYMAKFPFNKIIGIEYSHSLFLNAQRNIERMKEKNIQIIYCDAGCYDDIDDINYFYMFNPFGLVTIKRVLDHICKSYIVNPRVIKIIYKNPSFHNEIISRGIFMKVAEYKAEFDIQFYVYKTNVKK